jgi:hypothetical protein
LAAPRQPARRGEAKTNQTPSAQCGGKIRTGTWQWRCWQSGPAPRARPARRQPWPESGSAKCQAAR